MIPSTTRPSALARLACAALALAMAPSASHAQPVGGGTPVALVIGNADYAAFPKLQTCEVSANLVASVLSRAGFKVVRQSNPSNARLGTAIASLGEDAAAAPGSRLLIYLCSYAAGYSDRLFILPAEARVERDADVLTQGIVARLLMGSAAGPGSAAGLVLMDVAPPPGRGTLDFTSMLRPAEAAHGGLAAAALPAADAQRPAPLAGALADMVAGGQLEVGAALNDLGAMPGMGRALLFVRPPAEPSWLLGHATTPEPRPVAENRTPASPSPPSAAPATVPPFTAPVPAPPSASLPSSSALADPNPAERRRLQLALQRLGYFKGRIDGVFGPDTAGAIRQFQRDSNADPSGKLTARQAEQLLQ